MPIFMQYDGIKGNVTNAGRGTGGGVWKTTDFLTGGTTNRKGGNHIAVGDLDFAARNNVIEVSSISLPQTSAYSMVIDGRDANAVVKTKMMFDAQRSGGTFTLTFNGQVTKSANNIRGLNELRQIALNGLKVPQIEIFVSNGVSSKDTRVQLAKATFKEFTVTKKTDTAVTITVSFGHISYD